MHHTRIIRILALGIAMALTAAGCKREPNGLRIRDGWACWQTAPDEKKCHELHPGILLLLHKGKAGLEFTASSQKSLYTGSGVGPEQKELERRLKAGQALEIDLARQVLDWRGDSIVLLNSETGAVEGSQWVGATQALVLAPAEYPTEVIAGKVAEVECLPLEALRNKLDTYCTKPEDSCAVYLSAASKGQYDNIDEGTLMFFRDGGDVILILEPAIHDELALRLRLRDMLAAVDMEPYALRNGRLARNMVLPVAPFDAPPTQPDADGEPAEAEPSNFEAYIKEVNRLKAGNWKWLCSHDPKTHTWSRCGGAMTLTGPDGKVLGAHLVAECPLKIVRHQDMEHVFIRQECGDGMYWDCKR